MLPRMGHIIYLAFFSTNNTFLTEFLMKSLLRSEMFAENDYSALEQAQENFILQSFVMEIYQGI
jgi:hypothetical protein